MDEPDKEKVYLKGNSGVKMDFFQRKGQLGMVPF